MFKKVLYAGSFCALALLASCGNRANNETENEATGNDTTIIGEVVTGIEQAGDSVYEATAEAVDTITNAVAPGTDAKQAETTADTSAK